MSFDSSRLEIIIAGGGLAGMATAGYLRKHHNVTVLERSKLDFSSNDYAMSIVSNAYKLMIKQGVDETNLQPTILSRIWICDQNGTVLREAVFDTLQTYGASSVFTRRSRLHSELHRFATDDSRPGKPAQVVDNVKIVSVDVQSGEIITESGEMYRGDLIVGADGINSAVRAAVLSTHKGSVDVSEGTAALPTGLAAYMSTVPASFIHSEPKLAFQAGENAGMAAWHGSDGGKRRILAYPADSEHFQIVAYHSDEAWTEQFERNKTSIIKNVPADRVLEDFEDFHPSVKKMLSHSTTSDVWRIRDIEPLPLWHAGKAILIGDAAHAITPHLGQGCNIAIEDAEALGYFFRDVSNPAQLTQALESFESLRVPRAHMVQFLSRQAGGLLRGAEKDKAGKFDTDAFRAKVYSYPGAEDAWKAMQTYPRKLDTVLGKFTSVGIWQ
jgi:salicylate hydroxylase